MHEVNIRFQAINADALINVLAGIDIFSFFAFIPVFIKEKNFMLLTIGFAIRFPAMFAIIARHFAEN